MLRKVYEEVFDVFVWADKGGVIRVCEDQALTLVSLLEQGHMLQLGDFCRIVPWGTQYSVATQDGLEYTDSAVEAIEWMLGYRIEVDALAA